MLDKLDHLDKKLLLFFNSFHNSFLDGLMFYISKTQFWIPLFLVLVILTIKNFKKHSILIFVLIALTITLADQSASSIMKPYFKRLRPCHEPTLEGLVHTVNGCGGQYGFVSSHASNTFAVATLFVLLFWRKNKSIVCLFVWAIIVSFSRVYLGRHYPGDVLMGGILGILIAFFVYWIYLKLGPKLFPTDANR